MLRHGLVIVVLNLYLLTASASAQFTVAATDFTGSSQLNSGTFVMQNSITVDIAGANAYADADLDGFSETLLPVAYDTSIMLSSDFFLLHLDAGNVSAYNTNGAVSTSFDWALTYYDDFVNGGGMLNPIGSVLYGTATFEADRTVLHISESLLWSDSIVLPGWLGYSIAGFNALELTATGNGEFTITAIPAPASALALVGLMFNRRRRR